MVRHFCTIILLCPRRMQEKSKEECEKGTECCDTPTRQKMYEPDTWTCEFCTIANGLDVNKCTMCASPRPRTFVHNVVLIGSNHIGKSALGNTMGLVLAPSDWAPKGLFLEGRTGSPGTVHLTTEFVRFFHSFIH